MVKLLSGGNPQIPKGDGEAPVAAYLDAMPEWKGIIGRRLDELIVEAIPELRKSVRWNSPFYGVEGMNWFLSFHCYDKFVRVSFFRGTSLNPQPPGASKVEGNRYYDIHHDESIDEPQFTSWVRQAAKIPGWGDW